MPFLKPALLTRLRWQELCSDKTEMRKIQRFCASCPWVRFVTAYGPTECTVSSTLCPIDTEVKKERLWEFLIGWTCPGNRIYVTKDIANLCPVGIPGELCIGGDQVPICLTQGPVVSSESPHALAGRRLCFGVQNLSC